MPKKLTLYDFSELNEAAQIEVAAGSYYYAIMMMTNSQRIKPQEVEMMWDKLRGEYMAGLFSENGITRWPNKAPTE
jgi:hypothetical protein